MTEPTCEVPKTTVAPQSVCGREILLTEQASVAGYQVMYLTLRQIQTLAEVVDAVAARKSHLPQIRKLIAETLAKVAAPKEQP